MPQEQPLWHKLYFREPYIELARAIGYREVPVTDLHGKVTELCDRFGKEAMKAISEELVDIEKKGDEHIARLKPHVRKLCWQLLGPPPDYPHLETWRKPEALPYPWQKEEVKNEPEPEPKPKKPRRKKSPAAVPPASSDGDGPEPISPGPLLQQYREAKERHPGMLLLFRMGDFYELFKDDAEIAAKLLGLTLTTRDSVAMAGFPHHSLETYLKKLLQAGHRVAVCDQVVDATTVRREVTRVVTPGSMVDGQHSA